MNPYGFKWRRLCGYRAERERDGEAFRDRPRRCELDEDDELRDRLFRMLFAIKSRD